MQDEDSCGNRAKLDTPQAERRGAGFFTIVKITFLFAPRGKRCLALHSTADFNIVFIYNVQAQKKEQTVDLNGYFFLNIERMNVEIQIRRKDPGIAVLEDIIVRKEKRIKDNKEFQQVFQRGKSMANRQFVIYILDKNDQDTFRIGLSVSKKVGNAVTRNRIKRYVRQSFHELEDQIARPVDFVIIARHQTATMSMEEVKESLIHVLKKLKMLKR